MMRHVIWAKDDYFPFSTPLYMDAETITLPRKEIPMLEGFDLNERQLGIIKDVKTVDGEMTCEIDWFTNPRSEAARASIESGETRLVGGFFDTEIDVDVVTKAELRYVSWRPVEGFYPSNSDNSGEVEEKPKEQS